MCLGRSAHVPEESALLLGSDFSPDWRNVWRNGCPTSLEWISSGPTSEADGGFEFCEHNVVSMAIEVIGQDRSSEVISLFLEDWKVGRVALSCHLSVDLLCLDSPRSVCSECQRSSLVEMPQFLTVDGL